MEEKVSEEGIEIRFVSQDKDLVDMIGDNFHQWAKQNWDLEEFFDGKTTLSTHPRYKNSYIRRIRMKLKSK